MLKLLSDEWIAAEQENKAIRDRLRTQFWSEAGIVPAINTGDIDLSPAERIGQMQALADRTLSGKEDDTELAAITRLACALIGELAPGSFSHGGGSLALNMALLTPKALRGFFLSDDLTSYEVSESS